MSQLPIEQVLERRLPLRKSRFPHFRSLPFEIRLMIWECAIDDDRPRYIIQEGEIRVIQKPPVLAHVCQQSRKVALKTGRMYEVGNRKWTWFRPETDLFLWRGFYELGYGELPGHVRHMVIPRYSVEPYHNIYDTFEFLFNKAGFTQLDTIYVDMSYAGFTPIYETWHPEIRTRLFKTDTILTPNLLLAEDELSENIDFTSHLLPNEVADYWEENRDDISFTEVNEWTDHMAGEMTSAWVSIQARRTSEVGEDQVKAVENKVLMHPSGISWWAYFANNAPAFTPTLVLTRLSDREVVQRPRYYMGTFLGRGFIEIE